ncbi:hypothetical protein EON83_15730 [bacterium]|nr:MAG: hypothetical protein EON83_15730 [bacterium]
MPDSQLLAPWEYEGKMPQVTVAGDVLFQGEVVRFELLWETEPNEHTEREVRNANRLVFRRGDDDGSWTIPLYKGRLQAKNVMARLIWGLEHDEGVRDFWFGVERARISPNGIGQWGYDMISSHGAYFSLGRRISKMTSSRTHAWLEELLSRYSSALYFTRAFWKGDSGEQWRQAYGFDSSEAINAAHDEMRGLCRCVLHSDRDL